MWGEITLYFKVFEAEDGATTISEVYSFRSRLIRGRFGRWSQGGGGGGLEVPRPIVWERRDGEQAEGGQKSK